MEFSKIHKTNENYILWGFKIFAGVMIVGFLGIHYVVNHLLAPGGLLTYNDILAYYQNPIVPVMEIAFLILVVSHALLGVRSILLDLHLPPSVNKGADILLVLVGLGAIAYGVWLVIRVIQAGV